MSAESFESKFGDILTTELRRQGLPDFSEHCKQITARLKRLGITALAVNCGGMKLGDRGCVAVVETLLKTATHPAAPPDWMVDFADNAITDRIVGHMILLMQRCQKIVTLDLSRNSALSISAMEKLCDAHKALMSSRPTSRLELVLIGSPSPAPAPAATADQRPAVSKQQDPASQASRESSKPTQAPVTAATLETTPSASAPTSEPKPPEPTEATKRRRDAREGSAKDAGQPHSSHQGNTATRHSKAVADRNGGAAPLVDAAAVAPVPAFQQPTKSSLGRATQKPSKDASGAATAAPRASSRSPSPRSSGQNRGSAAGATQQPVASAFSVRGSGRNRSPASNVPASSRQQDAIVERAVRQTRSASPRPAAVRQHGTALHDDRTDDANRDDDAVSSVSTTATEVPDHQDFLDITANVNPMIDHTVSLENQGVPSDVLLRRLREALSLDPRGKVQPANFCSVTILNLSSNHLTSLDGSVFPESLLRVDLSDNLLSHVPSMKSCPMLTVANLRRNKIRSVGSSLDANLNIGHLFLGRNELKSVEGLGHLWVLETLDISFNRIASVSDLRPLSLNGSLRHLIVNGNPLGASMKASYRPLLRNLCPSLIAVDNQRLPFSLVAENRQKQDRLAGLDGAVDLSPGVDRRPRLAGSPQPVDRRTTPGANNRGIGYAVRNMLAKGVASVAAGYSSAPSSAFRHRPASDGSRRGHAGSAVGSGRDAQQRGVASRKQVLAHVCEKSKHFLEKAIVERLTATAEKRRALEGIEAGNGETVEDIAARTQRPTATTNGPREGDRGPSSTSASNYLQRAPGAIAGAAVADAARDHRQAHPPHVEDRWRDERERAKRAAASPSPPPYPDRMSRSPLRKSLDRPQERPRSRSGSNASSRSPSPMAEQGHAFPVYTNEPLGSASKRANGAKPDGRRPPSPVYPLLQLGTPKQRTDESRRRNTSAPAYRPQEQLHQQTQLPRQQPRRGGGGDGGRRGGNGRSSEPLEPNDRNARMPFHGDPITAYHDSEEIVLSPEGPSSLTPSKFAGKQLSPIRNLLDLTDVSAEGSAFANHLVPRMDPGTGASPLPRPLNRTTAITPLAKQHPVVGRGSILSPAKDEADLQHRSARNSPRPLLTPAPAQASLAAVPPPPSQAFRAPPPHELDRWVAQFQQDVDAVKVSLRTVVDLVWSVLHAKDAETAQVLEEERARCFDIISHSRLLDDTELPLHVVRYYGFRSEELNDSTVAQQSNARSNDEERNELLEAIHEMGSSKTCLRYLMALVQQDRKDLLWKYVDSVRRDLFG